MSYVERSNEKILITMDEETSKMVKSLRWEDKFFANEDGLIAVFDFDYEQVASFQKTVASVSMLVGSLCLFPCLSSLCCYPCCYRNQIDWDVYSQHIAITRDGIKFVRDKRHRYCGLACQDAGKESKTIPFDKITDCDITEAAGATCCCIDNVYSVVSVDTASSGNVNPDNGARMHELTIAGLKDPLGFKKLVWSMKRATAAGGGQVYAAPSLGMMDRGFGNDDTNQILKDIRNELKELNSNLKNKIADGEE